MVKTVVTHRDAVIKSQGYLLKNPKTKKATQSQIDNAYRKAFSNLDSSFCASNQMDTRSALQQMVGSAGPSGGSFQMDQYQLAGIRESVEKDEEQKEEAAATEPESEDEGKADGKSEVGSKRRTSGDTPTPNKEATELVPT